MVFLFSAVFLASQKICISICKTKPHQPLNDSIVQIVEPSSYLEISLGVCFNLFLSLDCFSHVVRESLLGE